MIVVTLDPALLADVQSKLAHIKNGAARAVSRALNKSASKAKTRASVEIRKQVRLSAAYVREHLYGPSSGFQYKATINKLQARISAKRRGVLLRQFSTTKQRSMGRPKTLIRVTVKPGVSKRMPNAFWVNLLNNNGLAIAVRDSANKLKVLHGPSLSQVLTTVKDDILSEMRDTLTANLQHEMNWLLRQYPPPADDGSTDRAD